MKCLMRWCAKRFEQIQETVRKGRLKSAAFDAELLAVMKRRARRDLYTCPEAASTKQ